VRITIQDDGSGMPQGVWATSCGGLRNIQQRLKELGGALQVESSPQGTRLFMEIPPHQEVMARSA
jgi:signal transduction histidine kinase